MLRKVGCIRFLPFVVIVSVCFVIRGTSTTGVAGRDIPERSRGSKDPEMPGAPLEDAPPINPAILADAASFSRTALTSSSSNCIADSAMTAGRLKP